MGYFDSKVAPKREQRLKTLTNAFGGNACELLKCANEGCLNNKKRSFSQASACQLGLVLGMATTMPDALFIIHGPVGCGSQCHGIDGNVRAGTRARGGNPKPLIWYSTNLKENDVIGGGESRLRETIIEADRIHRPDNIFVLASCTPSIIGDDLDEVINSTQKIVAARLIPLHCEGIKSQVVANAYDVYYHGVGRNLDLTLEYEEHIFTEDDEYSIKLEEYKLKKSRTVNLFNMGSITCPDEIEITRLLKGIGLNVRIFPDFAHPQKFRTISEAALNISMCNVHDDYFLEFLKEKFGMPYLIYNMPLGIKNTSEWLIKVAKELGIEEKAKMVIETEEAEVRAAIEPLKEKLKDKTVLISGGVIRVAANSFLVKELGCKLIGIRPYHYDNLSNPVYEEFAEEFPEIQVNVSNLAFEFINILKKVNPDIAISHMGSNLWPSKLGIPSIPLFGGAYNYFGYKGAYELARRMVRALENTSFQQKLSENTKLPYYEEWYEKSPYHYIK